MELRLAADENQAANLACWGDPYNINHKPACCWYEGRDETYVCNVWVWVWATWFSGCVRILRCLSVLENAAICFTLLGSWGCWCG